MYKFIIEHAGCIAKASQEDWFGLQKFPPPKR